MREVMAHTASGHYCQSMPLTKEIGEAALHLRDLILSHSVHHTIPHSIPVHYDTLRQSPILLGSEVTAVGHVTVT